MSWIRRNLAAAVLTGIIAVLAILFLNGNLQWKHDVARHEEHAQSEEAGEASEKRVSQGRVVLDEKDLKASGILVAAVQEGSVNEMLEVPGEIEIAQDHLAQVTPLIPGRVRTILKLAGDAVSRGTTLCTIESAELGGARADLQSALAEASVADRSLGRMKQLYEKGLRSESELLATEAEYNRARLHVDAARAHLRALAINPDEPPSKEDASLINQYELRSPIAGTILQQQLTVGQNVEQKDVLFTVADLSKVWVNASVNERDVARLRGGTASTAQVQTQSATSLLLTGVITYIGQQADQQTRTVPVRVLVSNPRLGGSQGFALRPGMFTAVRFPTGVKKGVLTLPSEAIQEVNGQSVVFVRSTEAHGGASPEESKEKAKTEKGESKNKPETAETESAVFEPRSVTVGVSDGKNVEILAGLKRGEIVVIRNAFLLKSELEKEKIGDVD
jgi:cobalt-zinc-cadmium efflux system membrane fusion protein